MKKTNVRELKAVTYRGGKIRTRDPMDIYELKNVCEARSIGSIAQTGVVLAKSQSVIRAETKQLSIIIPTKAFYALNAEREARGETWQVFLLRACALRSGKKLPKNGKDEQVYGCYLE